MLVYVPFVDLLQQQTRKSCSETNTKAAFRYRQSAISTLIEIGKLSQGLFYITALAIMQHFPDNEKKTIRHVRQSAILYFISAKFIMGYPCVSAYKLFYVHGLSILLLF